MEEQEIKNESIKQRILEFVDEIEAKYLAEYNEKIQNGEKDVAKTSISEIHYYEEIKFSSRFEMKPLKGVYVVYNTDKSIDIYKEDIDKETGNVQRELMATVNEKRELVFTEEYKTLGQMVTNKKLEDILNSNEENKELELKQETIEAIEMEEKAGNIKKDDIDQKEIEELEQESDSAEQVVAMAELEIMPGTVQELPIEEINDSPDFKGHNRVAFGYSKAEHGYVFFDKNTGEKLVGPAVAANRQVITQSNGEIAIERHSAMMAPPPPDNSNRLYTVEIGPYGDRQLNIVTRTPEGNFVGRGMNICGKNRETDNATIKAMNNVGTRENMGETAEDLVRMGVTSKKNAEWKMSGAEFIATMREHMGPTRHTDDNLFKMYSDAADELEAEGIECNLGNVVKRAIENLAKEQAKDAGENRIKIESQEGRALGDRPEDPRRG